MSIPSEEIMIKAIEQVRALAHPLRLHILAFIDKNVSVQVNMIYHNLMLEQSITSQHLRILREAHLVKTKKEGKMIYYTVDYDRIRKMNQLISDFMGRNQNVELDLADE